MRLSISHSSLLAMIAPFTAAQAQERSTASLSCGGSAFELRASGSSFSFINGAYVGVGNFAEPASYSLAAFSNGMGTIFKLDESCHLVVSSTNMTAQILPGAANKDQPLYFQHGTGTISGQTPEQAICYINKKSKRFKCPKAGSDRGLVFHVVTGTQVQAMYEIGQPLLALANKASADGNYTPVTLTAVKFRP